MTTPLIPFAAGSRLTAAELVKFLPLTVIKPTDQSVISSAVLVNDNALLLPLAVANATYLLVAYLDYEAATSGAGDLKIGWTVPSGTTIRHQCIGVATTGSVTAASAASTSTQASTPAFGGGGAAVLMGLTLNGTVVVSSTTGTLQFRWAQNSTSGTATIVHAQSYLALTRVS